MLSLLNSTGCSGACTSGCDVVYSDFKKSGRLEYGVFVGYYSESEESDYESEYSGGTENGLDEVNSVKDSEAIEEAFEEGEADVIREMFNETASGGKCSLEEANHLAHRIGLAPSKADLEKLRQEVGDNITLDEFERWSTSIIHPEDHFDYMVSYFRKYDLNRSGMITKKQFIWLTSIGGEVLTREEAETILNKLSLGDMFNYEEMLRKVLEIESADKKTLNITKKKSEISKINSNKVLISQISTTIRDLADNESFLPSIDLLEALRSTYGSQLTIEAASKTAECCEDPQEAAKQLLSFYSEWVKNKGMVSRSVVRDLLMVWKAKLDRVGAEAWITSLSGTDEMINIQEVLKNVCKDHSIDKTNLN
ncbi:myosin light chain [Cryptosporidium ryanae]|uniref:myosin light chain n=1 Tax=Cryptosporidium ryanae TaxID=515981 RepID=UPI00351A1B6B|nr:myosin light chain [Cryptosporidium ryanae]